MTTNDQNSRGAEVGKVFAVLPRGMRHCLVCEQVFTRQGAAEHGTVVCHPQEARFCGESKEQVMKSVSRCEPMFLEPLELHVDERKTEQASTHDSLTLATGRSCGIIRAMSKPRRSTTSLSVNDTLFAVKQRKVVPHEFVLDAIAPLLPWTRPMFGCLAVYVEDKIVLVLRGKRDNTADNGVWLATTADHHESLRREFPNMRSIQVLGKKVTGWQVLPDDAPDFEEAALHACELILARDPRIGKVPGARRSSGLRTRKGPRSFSDDTLAVLRKTKGLRIRAGTGWHRFIGIWVVVVRDRVFVRSWSVKPNGWYRTFLKEPRGTIQVADCKIAIGPIRIKNERLRDAIDRAYLEKYNTTSELKYAKDLGRAKSRGTTIEIVPLSATQ